jgi:hypothetical protein
MSDGLKGNKYLVDGEMTFNFARSSFDPRITLHFPLSNHPNDIFCVVNAAIAGWLATSHPWALAHLQDSHGVLQLTD